MSATRRVYLYLVTLVALSVLSAGVGQLLALLFDVTLRNPAQTQVGSQAFNTQQLSLGLAMLVIAGPLWFFFWRAIQRRVAGSHEETGAGLRKVYLNLILIVTAFAGLGTASGFLGWLFAGVPLAEFPSGELAATIVSALIWQYHRRVSETEGHPSEVARTLRRWYVYIISGFGLVWLSVGIVQIFSAALLVLPFWRDTFVRGQFWNDTTQMGVSWLLLGGLTWYFHWFRMAKGDADSVLRQVYFYLLTISGGAIAALTALTSALYQSLKWLFGGVTFSAGQHFQSLGWSVITVIVGVAVWGYHQRLVQEEQQQVSERRLSSRRIHLYLMSFIGLGTLVSGLIFLFGILFRLLANAISPPVAGSAGWWKDQLSLCLSLLVVGAPLWFYFWGKVLRLIGADSAQEWRARSRRIFLYVVVGAAIGTLVADLVNIVYQILTGILQGNFGVRVLRDVAWSLQTLIVAAPLLWYHWRIIRADQRRGSETPSARKSVTLLIGERSAGLAVRLGEKLGYKVRPLYLTAANGEEALTPAEEELARLVSEIETAPGPSVLLIVSTGKINVFSYRQK